MTIEISLHVHNVLLALGFASFCSAIGFFITDLAPEDEDTRYVLHLVCGLVELMTTLGIIIVTGVWVE